MKLLKYNSYPDFISSYKISLLGVTFVNIILKVYVECDSPVNLNTVETTELTGTLKLK